MRKLLFVTLLGMALSKLLFHSLVPPEVKVKAPGFDVRKAETRDQNAFAAKPREVRNVVHR